MKNKIFILLSLLLFMGELQPSALLKKPLQGHQGKKGLQTPVQKLQEIRDQFYEVTKNLIVPTNVNGKKVDCIQDTKMWKIWVDKYIHNIKKHKERISKDTAFRKTNAWSKYLEAYKRVTKEIKNKKANVEKPLIVELEKERKAIMMKEERKMLIQWEVIEDELFDFEIIESDEVGKEERKILQRLYNEAIQTLQSYRQKAIKAMDQAFQGGTQNLLTLSGKELAHKKNILIRSHQNILKNLQKEQLNIANIGKGGEAMLKLTDTKKTFVKKYNKEKKNIKNGLKNTEKAIKKQFDHMINLVNKKEVYSIGVDYNPFDSDGDSNQSGSEAKDDDTSSPSTSSNCLPKPSAAPVPILKPSAPRKSPASPNAPPKTFNKPSKPTSPSAAPIPKPPLPRKSTASPNAPPKTSNKTSKPTSPSAAPIPKPPLPRKSTASPNAPPKPEITSKPPTTTANQPRRDEDKDLSQLGEFWTIKTAFGSLVFLGSFFLLVLVRKRREIAARMNKRRLERRKNKYIT